MGCRGLSLAWGRLLGGPACKLPPGCSGGVRWGIRTYLQVGCWGGRVGSGWFLLGRQAGLLWSSLPAPSPGPAVELCITGMGFIVFSKWKNQLLQQPRQRAPPACRKWAPVSAPTPPLPLPFPLASLCEAPLTSRGLPSCLHEKSSFSLIAGLSPAGSRARVLGCDGSRDKKRL